MKIRDLPTVKYEVLAGPAKGKSFEHKQTKSIQAMVDSGTLKEVKELKAAPETKELKHVPQTKEKKHRKRVQRNNKN